MKKALYSFISLILVSSMLLLCGCEKKTTLKAYTQVRNNQLTGEVTVTNENYTLEWNDKRKTVVLKDNVTGEKWSPIPMDVLNNNKVESGIIDHPQTESVIMINYYDTSAYIESKSISATAAVKNGRVNAVKTNNGFSVVYDFKSENITVTVDYILNSDGMSIEIDPNKITENPDRIVTSIDVAPFFCSAKNGVENGYVFVPSGSGALIYSNVNMKSISETKEPVYGKDLSVYDPYDFTNEKSIRMPVYGAVSNGKGIFAIIEHGASSSNIKTVSNDERLRYTSVYTNFDVRGYETVDIPKGIKLQNSTGKVYSEPLTDRKISIRYIPLSGEKASYYGMAEIYRNYLVSKYKLAERKSDQAVVLRVLGGVMTTEFNLGIPSDELYPLTTIEQAGKIIETSNNKYKNNVRFVLDGYGSTGLEVGEFAGGLEVGDNLGSDDELKKLLKKCQKSGIDVAMNFDIVRYNQSSAFNTSGDIAVAATGKKVINKYSLLTTKMQTDIFGSYNLLSRNLFSKAVNKVKKYAGEVSLKNVMLDTASNTLYSDYNFKKYYAKGNEEDIYKALKSINKSGYGFVASDANIYAAVCAEYIDNAPVYSSNFDSFSTDIPFYQIVLKGIVPMYTPKWSGATNERDVFLKAVESGMGLSMSVSEDYSSVVFSSPQKLMFASGVDNYYSHMELLEQEKFFDYYSSVKGAKIVDHTVIEKDVRKTVFDNGITVFVNYSDYEYVYDNVSIPANGYMVNGR